MARLGVLRIVWYHPREFFCFGVVNLGSGIFLFCCVSFFFLCRLLMGLLCDVFVVVVFVGCLVMGRFRDVFDVRSSTRRLIMRFVAFSSCVVFHLG